MKVDFHCHSSLSDGLWDPEIIALHAAEAGVRYAALTDHHTLEGLDRFEAACERHGVGFVTGVELPVLQGKKEVHLLCYGFDRTDAAFGRVVTAVREAEALNSTSYSMFEKKRLPELIQSVHQAGGIVLLAHPLLSEPHFAKLETLVTDLAQAGLDGIEVYHPTASSEQRALLRELAAQKGFVVSGGTDHHGFAGHEGPALGVDIPANEWQAFRDLLLRRRKQARQEVDAPGSVGKHDLPAAKVSGRVEMLFWMALPALSAVVLFTIALFGFFLPGYEKSLMDRKREMIRELTSTVWSMLDEAEKNVRAERLSAADARNQVVERVRALRYGREGKDYFWLQDLTPRMLMHPYRSDLEGQDLSDFKDSRGIRIFTEFADKVRQDHEGYVDYVWQWKDDPSRLEVKESYIRLFEPWGWVIGTGLYVHDVVREIDALKRKLLYAMGAVIAVMTLLLLVMLRGRLRSEGLRASAERRLQESHERYLSLVRAAAEGVLFVRNRRCVYANPVFLEFAGCEADELPLLDWQELFPGILEQGPFFTETGAEIYTEALLRRRDGIDLKCRIAHKVISENGSGGFVVLVRRPEETGVRSPPMAGGLLKRLLNLPSSAAEDIAREIDTADSSEQVVGLCRRVPALVSAMLESGASPAALAGMISSITDAATSRFIDMAQAELGPAPVGFAFVALGSQGRQEQTLFTDQDNAIVYDTPGPGAEATVESYFSALAGRVCEALTRSGYRDCKGLVMANNPKWRQPVDVWKGYFKNWITKPEEHEMMEFGTFFDLRCVKGDDGLTQILRSYIQNETAQSPLFYTQAARTAILFKSPLRLFGSIVSAGGGRDKAGHLDLKAVMMPIVSFARLYSLHRNISFTSTQERLSALSDLGVLLPSQHHDIVTAFETLLRLRLRHQAVTIQNGGEPDNLVDPSWLGHIDEAVLKECFKEIDRIQERISRDFLGGDTRL